MQEIHPIKRLIYLTVDVQTHGKIHELQNRQRIVKACQNEVCGNIQSAKFLNPMQLCTVCFKWFWSTRHDPDNRLMKQKIMEKYHAQMTIGCDYSHCRNQYCSNSSDPTIPKSGLLPNDSALKAVELLKQSYLYSKNPRYYFCVADPSLANRRSSAKEMNLVLPHITIDECINALMENNDDLNRSIQWAQRV
jgi:hypothetical protein